MGRLVRILLGAVALAAACSSSGARSDASSTGGTGTLDAATPDGTTLLNVSVDGARPRAGQVRMAVPAYFAPGPDWQRMIAGAPTVGMIIFNPDSGPGLTADSGYATVIAQAQAARITVLGYVATSYGQRAEADISADINRYYDLYRPSGIYLAEGPQDADCV